MSMSDETLMAYADGEADAATQLIVEAAMRSDPRIAQRVAQHRALRERVHGAFSADLSEPVPDALLHAARGHAITAGGDARSAVTLQRTRRPVRRLPTWLAVAASLLVGVLLGDVGLRQATPVLFAATSAGLVASGELATALSTQLASTQTTPATVRIGMTFLAKNGDYCRTFTLVRSVAADGLACRHAEAWQIQILARAAHDTAPAPTYRTAAAELPASILTAIEAQISGAPLDAHAESAARDAHWQPPP